MFGERLKLARKRAGYASLQSLVDALDGLVSKQALSAYETNKTMPRSDVLTALARKLDVSLDFLLSDQVLALGDVDFRKKAKTNAADRARVEAAVIESLERWLTVERVLGVKDPAWHPPFEPEHLTDEGQAEDLANRLRGEWNLGLDPIPNMTNVLEDQGLKVVMLDLPEDVSGLTCFVDIRGSDTRLPVIVVNRNHTLERRRSTLGHELGHRLIDPASPVNHEKAAQRFAGSFLVPAEHLRRELWDHRNNVAVPEIIQVKRMYRVSAAALVMRLGQTEILDEFAVAHMFRGVAKAWRKNEPAQLEAPDKRGSWERPKRFDRLVYHALAEDLISPFKAAELLDKSPDDVMRQLRGMNESPHP